ncbi:MAG TPA: membrane protein insertion efficiency factor YidD [Candidatus Bipolaricaulota bacterium]|nr:membrane protein insertion efficiency factor YidD [Candidatus Bipolaricaulota bacterium]
MIFSFIVNIPKFLVLKLIKFYQRVFSFDHGWLKDLFPQGFCKFHPTCSEYTYQAIEKYGLIRGGTKGVWRIMRCNPWSKGGNDPLK